MGRDIFLSHSKRDRAVADRVCDLMERRGISCWVAPRDVPPGAEFDEALIDAIRESKSMLLLLSSAANTSPFVKNEVNLAFSNGKTIFVLRIDDVLPSKALQLYLATYQWTDGFPAPVDSKIESLASAIEALHGNAASPERAEPKNQSNVSAERQRPPVDTDKGTPSENELGEQVSSPTVGGSSTATGATVRLNDSSYSDLTTMLGELAQGKGDEAESWRSLHERCRGVEVSLLCQVLQHNRTKAHRVALRLLRRSLRTREGREHLPEALLTICQKLVCGNIVSELKLSEEILMEVNAPGEVKWNALLTTISEHGACRGHVLDLLRDMTPASGIAQTREVLENMLRPTRERRGCGCAAEIVRCFRQWDYRDGAAAIGEALGVVEGSAAADLAEQLAEWDVDEHADRIVDVIERSRYEDRWHGCIGRLLSSLYKLRGANVAEYCAEVLLYSSHSVQKNVLEEATHIRERPFIAAAQELAATTPSDEIRSLASRFLALSD